MKVCLSEFLIVLWKDRLLGSLSLIAIHLTLIVAPGALLAQEPIWLQASGAYQGSVQCTAFSPAGSILIGTEGDGIFRSTNDGVSWGQIDLGITNLFIRSINFSKKGTAFAATYLYAGGLFRSTDLGTTWKSTTLGLTEQHVTSLAISPDDNIFAGTTDSGVYRSNDDGISWQHLGSGLPSEAILSLTAGSGGMLFAGTVSSGVYRSSDNGTTWKQTAFRSTAIYALLLQPSGVVFAGTATGAIISTDSGASWQNAGFGTIAVYALASNERGVVFAGTLNQGVYVSNDVGLHWRHSLTNLSSPFVNSLAIRNAEEVVAGTLHGVFLSHDTCYTWEPTHTALGNSSVLSILALRSGVILSGTDGSGIFSSIDKGESWQPMNTGLGDSIILTLTQTANSSLIATGAHNRQPLPNGVGSIFRSTDQGNNWHEASRPSYHSAIYSVAQTPQGNLIAASGNEGLFQSLDDGETWSRLSLDSGEQYVIAADSAGNLYAKADSQILVSKDQGFSWSRSFVTHSKSLYIASTRAGTVIVDGARSIDHGATWQLDPFTGDPLVATHDGAIFVRRKDQFGDHILRSLTRGIDLGTPFEQGLFPTDQRETYQLTCLVESNDGYLFAGTNTGVHKTLKPESELSVHTPAQASALALEQNYPNPFASTTTIGYSLPERADAEIVLFDELGRTRLKLFHATQEAGHHSIVLDASSLERGLYWYTLTSAGHQVSEKLIVIR